jgi:hypothetical protein
MRSEQMHYQALRQWVGQLQAIVTQQSGIADFQMVLGQMPQGEGDEATLAVSAKQREEKVRSYQIEIDKQLRMLEMDLMFLKTARQVATSQQRWQMMGDRLRLLGAYCDGILALE